MDYSDVVLELKAIKSFLFRSRFNMSYRDCIETVKWIDELIKELYHYA